MPNNLTAVYLSKGNLISILRRYLHSCICYSAIYKNQNMHSLVKEGVHVHIYLYPT